MSLRVEAIDTHTLNRAPHHAIIALAYRRDSRAQGDALRQEAPVAEGHGAHGHKYHALAVAAQPHITIAVEHDVDNLGSVHVNAVGIDINTLKTARALDGQAEQTVASRTYINNI